MPSNRQSRGKIRNHVRTYREARNLTGRELARLVGIRASNLCQYESGRVLPSVLMGQKFAIALSCTVGDLWPLEDVRVGNVRCTHGKLLDETCTRGLCFREVRIESLPTVAVEPMRAMFAKAEIASPKEMLDILRQREDPKPGTWYPCNDPTCLRCRP